MTQPFFQFEVPADNVGECQPGLRPSLQYLFEDAFVRSPAVKVAVLACEPFRNNTPPPSSQTRVKPPVELNVHRTTLHLPPRGPSAAVK